MSFYYTQDYLYSSPNTHCIPQYPIIQQPCPVSECNHDFNSILLNDTLVMDDTLSTPQLYYSPIPSEEYSDLSNPWSHDWIDPPINSILDDPCQLDYQLIPIEKTPEPTLYDKKYACPVCNHRSKRRHNMIEHMQTHNPNRTKDFSCHICNRAFARKYDMKRHEKIHYRK